MAARAIEFPGRETRMPVVCAPLVAGTRDALLEEARIVATKQPDLVEWRVDFFGGLPDPKEVVATARALSASLGGIPLLFTRRSAVEGGHPGGGTDAQAVAAIEAVCAAGCVQMVDWEMDRDAVHLDAVRRLAASAGVQVVLSFHDFHATPSRESLVARFAKAQALGAHVAKIAVMPQSMQDVLTLLSATEEASGQLSIPLVSMAMGPMGVLTRACGWAFGSAMTFAVGASSSAPGQMAIADVRAAIALLRGASKTLDPGSRPG